MEERERSKRKARAMTEFSKIRGAEEFPFLGDSRLPHLQLQEYLLFPHYPSSPLLHNVLPADDAQGLSARFSSLLFQLNHFVLTVSSGLWLLSQSPSSREALPCIPGRPLPRSLETTYAQLLVSGKKIRSNSQLPKYRGNPSTTTSRQTSPNPQNLLLRLPSRPPWSRRNMLLPRPPRQTS